MTFQEESIVPTDSTEPVSPSASRWPSQRGGPYPRLRVDIVTKATQGQAVYMAVLGRGLTFRQAADELGLSLTTAWRRYWWFADWTLPGYYGRPYGPVPPQRGTRACPRGRPYLPTLDGVSPGEERNGR